MDDKRPSSKPVDEMSMEELIAESARLRRNNARLKARAEELDEKIAQLKDRKTPADTLSQ